uniref:Chalcone-flavonone isomerase family protein n=1 Tax=Lactuca sativa TaxID=4236 RepID=A0A9R1WH68_LACSA|nr:hypothetical protein LSAT_V11C200078840 [Lactuca sativa]
MSFNRLNRGFYHAQGVRGMEIEGNFVKFMGIGVYLEDKAISSLAVKWNGKTAAELTDYVEFFRNIITGVIKCLQKKEGSIENKKRMRMEESFSATHLFLPQKSTCYRYS